MVPTAIGARFQRENRRQHAAEFAFRDGAAHLLVGHPGGVIIHRHQLVLFLPVEVGELEHQRVRQPPPALVVGIGIAPDHLAADEIRQAGGIAESVVVGRVPDLPPVPPAMARAAPAMAGFAGARQARTSGRAAAATAPLSRDPRLRSAASRWCDRPAARKASPCGGLWPPGCRCDCAAVLRPHLRHQVAHRPGSLAPPRPGRR